MPRLVVFAACEKVIISQDENNPTLIALLTDIAGEVEVPEQISKRATIPMRWAVFSLWRQEAGETANTFEQKVRLIAPTSSKSVIGDAVSQFAFKGKTHRISLNVPAVPITESGDWTLECYVREAGSEWPQDPVGRYIITIHFTVKTGVSIKP
jgi:hypothetical protein